MQARFAGRNRFGIKLFQRCIQKIYPSLSESISGKYDFIFRAAENFRVRGGADQMRLRIQREAHAVDCE